jgi:hypothetical protein
MNTPRLARSARAAPRHGRPPPGTSNAYAPATQRRLYPGHLGTSTRRQAAPVRGRGGRTKQQLDEDAKRAGIAGRSTMTKVGQHLGERPNDLEGVTLGWDQLEQAVDH